MAGGGKSCREIDRPQPMGPSAHDIAQMLRPHAEAIARMVFPAARRAAGKLLIGSLHGEPGDSLVIHISGHKQGRWADYATSESDPAGKGDMLKLLQLTVGGGDIRRGIEEAKRFLNLDSMDPRALERMRLSAQKARQRAAAKEADELERKRRNAEGLWQSASPLTPNSPAFLYLAGRGIDFARLGRLPGAIRFHHAVWHAEKGRKLPAMVTKFNVLEGPHPATHVTWLDYQAGSRWVKLPPLTIDGRRVDCAKKIFGAAFQTGAHISLQKGEQRAPLRAIRPGTPVEVAEGIEDALSFAMAEPAVRVLAAGTLGIIGELKLPPQAGDLNILAQNDTKPEPIAALEDAIRKQQAQAREQAGDGPPRRVNTRRPPQGIKDWNDWLREGME